jgi:hypothetical protein
MAATVDILIKARDQASPELKQVAVEVKAIAPAAATANSGVDRFRAALGSVDARRTAADLGGLRTQVGGIAPATQQAAGGANTLKESLKGVTSLRGDFLNVKDAILGFASGFGVAALASKAFSEGITRAKAGFDLRVEIDSTRKAIDAQLTGVRTTAVVYAEAAKFADRYKLTQAELNSTLQSSTGLLASSNASTTDLLTTLSRLQVLAPEKPISEAARALRELQSGDTTSIKELFNLSAASANKLKAEIVGGGDAIQVVSRYLDSVNIGMDALDAKTTGATGKMKDLAIASEQFNLALGKIASSPVGLKILGIATDAATGAARIAGTVGGEAEDTNAAFQSLDVSATAFFGVLDSLAGRLIGTTQQHAALATQVQFTSNAYAQAEIAQAGATTATQKNTDAAAKSAAVDAVAAAKSEELKQAKERLTEQAQAAADRLLALGAVGAAEAARLAASSSDVDVLTAALYRLAAGRAAAAAAATNAAALADQRVGERSGGAQNTVAEAEEDAARKRSQDRRQRDIEAARNERIQATGTTAEKLALAQREAAATQAGTADRIRAETRVQELQRQAAAEREAAQKKGATAAARDAKAGAKDAADEAKARFALLDTEQQLAELKRRLASGRLSETDRLETVKQIKDLEQKITDEREKQVKSAIDARLAALDDRKQRRKEEQELAAARRVLGAADTSQAQKAAAQDAIERIGLERQQRALEIAQKTRAAGGQAAVPGAPALPAATAAALAPRGAGGLPTVPALSPQQIAQGGPVVNVAVYLDSQQIAARVITTLHGGLRQADSAGTTQGGR